MFIYMFSQLKSLIKIDPVTIDNNVFLLHYKLTCTALIAFSVFLTSALYIGEPISCIVDGSGHMSAIDTYCWIHSTFTLTNALDGRVGKNVVRPGVAPYVEGEDATHYHKYYQWVCFVMFFQAMGFYLPRFLWKMWEGKLMGSLSQELNNVVLDEERRTEQINEVVNYFAVHVHRHNFYAYRYFLCEFLNFFNVFAQIWFMNYFMDGEFMSYGLDVMRFSHAFNAAPLSRTDPMERVFPKLAKCLFRNYGPSGTVQALDALCVLSVNNINEKIFTFLWFWFLLVALVSTLNMAYRVVVVTVPTSRSVLLKFRSRGAPLDKINVIQRTFKIGDWFVLYQLGKNIQSTCYNALITELAKNLDGPRD